ncbi:hypothetical protein ACFVGY_12480 [Streptomyces sp. NPDC127106]|uniref:hypothetical protein n=1 Tax=Streptomyces sp. NPDC127106 TaxID=3345360 RepID=UPI003631F98B
MRRTVRFRRAVTALTLSTALLAGATGCSGGGSSGARAQGAHLSLPAAAQAEQIETVELQAALAQMRAEAASLGAASVDAVPVVVAEPTPTTTAERQKFAKTRFVLNAGLAAGATYQWIIKPYRAGKFKKGASGRTFALVKAGLAGAFAYNRLKAAVNNAKGDPLLSKALVPLTAGIESLKGLGTKLRSGQAGDADISSFEGVINGVKDAGKSAGAPVTDQVPSLSQLGG